MHASLCEPTAALTQNGSIPYFVTIWRVGVTVLVGAMGEIENVNHVFHPAGRLAASNSPYPFRLTYPCMSPTLEWMSQPRKLGLDNSRVIGLLPMLEISLSTIDWMSLRKSVPCKICPALLLQGHVKLVAIETTFRNSHRQPPKGRLSWTATLTILSGKA
jgi:uncharacterized protein (DUF983 family)